MKKFMIFTVFLACACSTSSDDFMSNAVGNYTLNSTGTQYINRAVGCIVASGTTLQFRGDGTLYAMVSDTEAVLIATMISIKNGNQASFQLVNTKTGKTYYAAMGNNNLRWLSTTNLYDSENSIRYDSFVPIATEDD